VPEESAQTNEIPTSAPNPSDILTFSRASDYKSIFSDLHQMRIGNGNVYITFSKTTRAPGASMLANIVEEHCEIVMTWPQIKMLALNLSATVSAVEEGIGPISIPTGFRINPAANLTAVKSLGFPSPPNTVQGSTGPSD
jgi:hypothetical protein